MRLRRAVPDDALAMMALVQEGFSTYAAFAPPGWTPPDETRPEMVESVARDLAEPDVFAYVAEEGDVMAGQVTLIPGRRPSPDGYMPDQHLRHLFVREAFWGTGTAVALHDALRPHLHGVARLFTPAPQARARRFYERESWVQHGRPFHEPRFGLDLVEYRLTSRSR